VEELAEIRSQGIGVVVQTVDLGPRTTARRPVEPPRVYSGRPRKERRDRAVAALN